MNYQEIVTISGKGGLFRVVNQKSNGVIVTALESGQSEFISLRQHALSYLDTTAVFVKNSETDSIEIIKVFQQMQQKEAEHKVIDSNADTKTITAYFKSVVPDYDEEKVHISDMKKILKWYAILKKHNLIATEQETDKAKE